MRGSCLLGLWGFLGVSGLLPSQERFSLRDLVAEEQPERREAAARYFVAVPESPGVALRNFARGGGWRYRVALLRVLGERKELGPQEILAGLKDPVWVVRRQALRAGALMDGALREHAVLAQMRRLLQDKFVAVGREAAKALGAVGEFGDAELAWACHLPRFLEVGRRIFLAWPARFSEAGFGACLQAKEGRAAFLLKLPGRLGAEGRARLFEEQKEWEDPGERCLAYRCLEGKRLQDPHLVTLVLQALKDPAGREAGRLLGHVLPQKLKGRFLLGLLQEKDAGVFEARLEIGEGARREDKALLRESLLEFPAKRRARVLRFLVEGKVGGLLSMALKKLGGAEVNSDLPVLFLRGLGTRLVRDPKGRRLLEGMLRGKDPERSLAFRLFCVEGVFVPELPLTALALAGGRRSSPLLSLLRFREKIPLSFWRSLFKAKSPKLRWVAYQGIRGRDWPKDLAESLLPLLQNESDRSAKKALLTTLLSRRRAITPPRPPQIARYVLNARKAFLDRKLLEVLEETQRPWATALLRSLLKTRLAPKAWVSLAVRGEKDALRRVLIHPSAFSAGELRRLRTPMAKLLREEDVPLLSALLLGDQADFAKLEIVLWLRMRPDLPVRELLERAYEKAKDFELREQLAGALVARGRVDLLGKAVERWISKKGDEDEGLLLEMLDALPRPLPKVTLLALARILAAPAARDPLQAVLLERRDSFFQRRVRASMPMVLPTLRALRFAKPEDFRSALIANLRDPVKSPAWFCVTKDYLAHLLLLAQEWPGTARSLDPLFAWADRLGPRPSPIDGVLGLLRAMSELRSGRTLEASKTFDEGLSALHLVAPDERSLQDLASLLMGVGQDSGIKALHFRDLWLQALRFRRDPERLAEILVSAEIAARGNLRFEQQISRLKKRLLHPKDQHKKNEK